MDQKSRTGSSKGTAKNLFINSFGGPQGDLCPNRVLDEQRTRQGLSLTKQERP